MNLAELKTENVNLESHTANRGMDNHSPREIARYLVEMTRLRLNMLVLVTTAFGFLLAGDGLQSTGEAWVTLANAIFGTALCGCAGSVLNQWVERGKDPLMRRTADRPLPTGRIDPDVAWVFGGLLSLVGTVHLWLFVNWLAAGLALLTIILYSFVYTPMKYRHWSCTIIGAIPGAIPPMIGCVAAREAIGIESIALFLILFAWQIPHFWAIGSIYRDEYAAADILILPVVDNKNLDKTMASLVRWSFIYSAMTMWPYFVDMLSPIGLAGLGILNIIQLILAFHLYRHRSRENCRRFFLWTVAALPLVLLIFVLEAVL